MSTLNATAAQRRARSVYDAATPKIKGEITRAKQWLKEQLESAVGGELLVFELNRAAVKAGFTQKLIKDARKALGCPTSHREGNWWVSLPPEAGVPKADVGTERFNDLSRTHEQCEDQFNVSVEERARLGISPDEQVCWIRDPQWWANKAPGQGADAWKRTNPGGRIITENGSYIHNGDDLVLAVRPMAEVEKLRAREEDEARRAIAENRRNAEGQKRQDDFDKDDPDRFYLIKQANHEAFVANGWTGPMSPSSGMDIQDYVRNRGLSEADVEREAVGWALGGPQVVSDMTDEQIMALSNPVPERGGRASGQPRGGDGKFYSLPPTIRPRNLMQPAPAAE